MARRYSRSASKDVKRAMHKRKRGTLKRGKKAAIYVFDSQRNLHIATLPLEHNANGVNASADGRWLLATWLDRVTAIEFPRVDELLAQVRAQLSRGLSDAERQEFGIGVTAPATAS